MSYSIVVLGGHICSGSILNEQWIITTDDWLAIKYRPLLTIYK